MESNNNKYSDEKSHIVSVLLTSALLSALTASSYFHKFPEKSPFNKENNIELPDSSNS